MRHLVLLTVIFFGMSAAASAACPNLQGTYTCKDNFRENSLTISSSPTDKVSVQKYTMDIDGESKVYTTDGKYRGSTANDYIQKQHVALCLNGRLYVRVSEASVDWFIYDTSYDFESIAEDGSSFSMTVKTNRKDHSSISTSQSQSAICTRD